jgi:Cu(I)/Ag(I) efflux system membrane fusion protein
MSRIFPTLLVMLLSLTACSKAPSNANPDVDYWTCTMHPSVHSKDPGKCPICSMDLVPVMKKGAMAAESASSRSTEFTVPVERQQQIGVSYATVETRPLSRTVRAVGIVEPDKKKSWSFVARTDGYVQQLFVASPGELVEKGAPLLSFYSPDLLTAEREMVMLSRQADKSSGLLTSAKARLRQWNVSDEQIVELERSGKPGEIFTLQSPFRGVVERVMAAQGTNIKTGDTLVEVADLSSVWVWADVYETELAFLQPGQKVSIAATAFPDRKFEGAITFIDPSVDPVKRTARARIDVPNADLTLRPGMFVDATFSVDGGTRLAVPVEAIMPTGSRNLAFVGKGEGKLEPRVVTLGGKFGEYYAVSSGLVAGESIVTSANFLIDAESKVQGALRDFGDDENGAQPPPVAASEALSQFVQSYLDLHQLLADDKFDGVVAGAATLREEAAALPDEAGLRQAVDAFKPANIEEARKDFGQLSAALLEVLQKSPVPRKLYVMRCPMWNSSPGEWVQVSKEVQNPFMGQAMATCGEAVRTLGK